MRLFRRVFSLLALMWGSPAVAGPISVNVEVTTQQTPGAPPAGPLDLTFDTQGNLQLAPGGKVDLGSARFGSSDGVPDTPLPAYSTRSTFNVDIKVTDTASGQEATFHIYGAARDEWMERPDGSWINSFHVLETGLSYWLGEPLIYRETLGDHQYVLFVGTNPDATVSDFDLYVDPGPGVVSPEPSSLLLGATALFPVGLRTIWRRARPAPARGGAP